MELIIRGWSAEGLRCPDMDVDLGEIVNEPKVTSCMLPNGTGKTTTISLIKSAMSLEVYREDDDDSVYGYQGQDNDTGLGYFELRMAIKIGAEQRNFDVMIDFNFFDPNPNTAAKFSTRTSEDGVSTPGNPNPPEEVQRFMNAEAANIFNVSGEDANIEPNRSIAATCGLDVITDLIDDIDEYYHKKADAINQETASNVTAQQGFTRLKRRLEKASNQLEKIKEIKDTAENEIKLLALDITQLDKAIGKDAEKHKKLIKAQQVAEMNKIVAEKDLDQMSKEFLDHMRNPLFFSDEFNQGMSSFKDSLDKHKLPENAGRPWFDELLKEDECICGNPMDDDAKRNIKMKQDQVLEGGFQTTLSTFKNKFSQLHVKALARDEFIKEYKEQMKKLTNASSQLRKAKEEFRQAQDTTTQDLIDELEDKKRMQSEKRGEIARYSAPAEPGEFQEKLKIDSFDDIESEDVMQKVVTKLEDDYTSMSKVRSLKNKTDLLKKNLEELKDQSLASIKSDLTISINEKLDKVFGDDLKFRVKEILDKKLALTNEAAHAGSQGQKRMLRYLFVSSLLDRSKNLLPLVVDHPTAALDYKRRAEFAEYVTKIDNQLIFFLTDAEKESFMDKIEEDESLKNKLAYMCIFKKSDGAKKEIEEAKDLEKKGEAVFAESKNGVVVRGKPFFDLFSIKDELGSQHIDS